METSDWEKSQPARAGCFPLSGPLTHLPFPAPARAPCSFFRSGPLPVARVSARRGRPRGAPRPPGARRTGAADVAPGALEAGPPVPLAEAGGAGQSAG